MRIRQEGGKIIMPLSDFEQQIYSMLLEMRQSAATTSSDIRCLRESFDAIRNEIEDIEELAIKNSHDIVKIKADMKAWLSAAAALGGFVGWFLSIMKEVFLQL